VNELRSNHNEVARRPRPCARLPSHDPARRERNECFNQIRWCIAVPAPIEGFGCETELDKQQRWKAT
jgi:hypothetical protein